jgi:excisionase family DNA binding protein
MSSENVATDADPAIAGLDELDDYIETAHAAWELGLSRATVLRAVRAGTVRAIRLGHGYRVHKDDLAKLARPVARVVPFPTPDTEPA